MIVEYPKECGNWYIVRCRKHNLNWFHNPLQAAGKHILANGHTCPSGKITLAIKELGELVEGCDQQKAETSNAEYKKAIDQGYKPRNTMTGPQKNKPRSATKKADDKSDQDSIDSFTGVINPVVGDVYYAWWDGEPRSWYQVVILPYLGDGDWKAVGITGNLFTSGLKKEIPSCFTVAKVTTDSGKEALRLNWAEGYQDGGAKVRARRFPCLFLHDPLTIPSADQEFVLGCNDEVLAFRPAQQLRHRSEILPSGLNKIGVDHYEHLARGFEARLGAIQAKQNSAPGGEVEDNISAQGSSLPDQQHPNATTSVESKESPCPLPASDVQDLRPHSSESHQPMSGDEHRDISDRHGLTARNPRVSLPSHLGTGLSGTYRSIQSADLDQTTDTSTYHPATASTSTTHRPSPNGREGGESGAESWAPQAASRQAQPMAMKSQSVCPPFALQQSSSTSQSPRAASAPAGEPRGPTALRPIRPRKDDEKLSDGPPQQNRASGLRNTANTVGKDALSNSAGQASWTFDYSEMP